MTQPRQVAGLCVANERLPSKQCEDSVTEGEYAANGCRHGERHERVYPRPKEEQPHAPTRDRFW